VDIFVGSLALSAVADLVVVDVFECVCIFSAVRLPLAARGREVALLALAPAAHARRVVGVVYGAQVASHLQL
jgi:hypothetical protein